jgi:NPCBM-associated, NEW3 domain of alpha-galactosidase
LNIAPLNPSIYPGQTAGYSVSVTNNDSSGCASSTVSLASTEPAGWSTSLSSSAITLNPGQSANVSLGKGAPSGTLAGTYAVNLTASSSVANITDTANATVIAAPALSVSVSISGSSFSRPGTVPVTASVVNGGLPAAGASVVFTLVAPNGGTSTQSASTNSSGIASWNVKLNQRSPAGTYGVTAKANVNSGSRKSATTSTVSSNTVTFTVQ